MAGGATGGRWPSLTRVIQASSVSFSCGAVAAPIARMPRSGARNDDPLDAPAGREPFPLPLPPSSPAGTATVECRAPSSSPGTCSSSTMWKLVPPNPYALTPHRRGVPLAAHSRASCGR